MLNNRICHFLVVTAIALVSLSAMAKPQMVEIKLVSIEAKKVTEKDGDELYFATSSYPSKDNPQILRVPMYPVYWRSKDLSKVKDVTLWKGVVVDDSSTLLIFSLLEQDASLLETEDHIGSAQLKIINVGGKVTKAWGQPKFKDQPKVESRPGNEYIMFGDNSEYIVKFKVSMQAQ